MSESNNKPAISFLLCTRNRSEIAKSCILNLLNSDRVDFEIVVRDNCSTDDTQEMLHKINDTRLKIHRAPENQETLNFFEISKLASGQIVTWLSDEDDFQFEHLDYILSKFENPMCNALFGSIMVGKAGRQVSFADEVIDDPVRANHIALQFSGCGGLFIRHSCLTYANSMRVSTADDAYMCWNYYPVGFFATRCINADVMLVTTSRIVVKQTRFAATTHKWNTKSKLNSRLPHYYPDSVFDRLASNITNVCFKNFRLSVKVLLIVQLVRGFYNQSRVYSKPDFISLLQENYEVSIVNNYINHLNSLKLDKTLFRRWWLLRKTIKLAFSVGSTAIYWKRLMSK